MLVVNQSSREFKLTMSATLANIDEADDRLAAYLQAQRLPVDIFVVRILLREALLNAVSHGGGADPYQSVSLILICNESRMTMQVTDPGPGFNWREQKTFSDTLEEGGRGLELMHIYADSVVFNEAGNQVTLSKDFKTAASVSEHESKSKTLKSTRRIE